MKSICNTYKRTCFSGASWIIAVILLPFASCAPEPIPIYLDEVESMPVIWSQAIPNSTTLVYLSRSFSALQFQEDDTTDAETVLQQFLAEDAFVTMTHNGSTDTLFKVSDGLFASLSTELVPGDSYQLYARDNLTGRSVNAQTQMYPLVPLDSVTYTQDDSSTVNVTLSFIDPPGSNWYAIHIYSAYANPLEVDDPFAAENLVETHLVSDLEFNSSMVTQTRTIEFMDSDTFYVSLNNISPEYFDYLSQRQRGGNIYNQLIQEPITYVSNIEGGFGMFSLNIPSIRQVIMAE